MYSSFNEGKGKVTQCIYETILIKSKVREITNELTSENVETGEDGTAYDKERGELK